MSGRTSFLIGNEGPYGLEREVKSDEADKFMSVLKKNDPKWFSIPE